MTVAELVAKLGIDMDRASWDRAQGALGKLRDAAEGVVAILGVRKIVQGIDQMISGSVDAAHEVKKLSDQLGISTDRVQELGYATKAVGEYGMSMALRTMASHAYAAAHGSQEAEKTFWRLGVSIRGANGQLLPADQLLERVADGMVRVKNPTERMALATTMFGRAGVRMVEVLKNGSAGMRKMYEEARRLGIMSKHMIELSEKEHHAQIELNYSEKTLRNTIVEKLLPGKIWLLEKTKAAVEWFTKLAQNTRIVEESMTVLAYALAYLTGAAFGKLLATLGPLGAAMLVFGAIMFLVIDDILTSLRGGKSLGREVSDWAGEIYDAFMKWESASKVVNALMAPLKALGALLKEIKEDAYAVIMLMQGGENAKAAHQWFREGAQENSPKRPGMIEGALDWMNERSGGMLRQAVGVNPSAVVTPSDASVTYPAQAGMSAPLTVHQTINALPGQSESAVGNSAADAIKDVWNTNVEQTFHKLVPKLLASVAGGGG